MRATIALIGIALVFACDLLEQRRAEVARVIVAIVTVVLLTACESVPPTPPPVIDNQPPMVVCAIPAGMTETEAEPAKPLGDYSQRDVGSYITALHQWGSRGWLRVDRIDQRSRECQARALAPNP